MWLRWCQQSTVEHNPRHVSYSSCRPIGPDSHHHVHLHHRFHHRRHHQTSSCRDCRVSCLNLCPSPLSLGLWMAPAMFRCCCCTTNCVRPIQALLQHAQHCSCGGGDWATAVNAQIAFTLLLGTWLIKCSGGALGGETAARGLLKLWKMTGLRETRKNDASRAHPLPPSSLKPTGSSTVRGKTCVGLQHRLEIQCGNHWS